jgi:hypothetical protein
MSETISTAIELIFEVGSDIRCLFSCIASSGELSELCVKNRSCCVGHDNFSIFYSLTAYNRCIKNNPYDEANILGVGKFI